MMKNITKTIIVALIITVTLAGCSKKDKKKVANINQIYKEKGVPVKIVNLQRGDFSKEFTYTAKLKGAKETFRASMIDGRILKVNAKVGDYVKKDDVIIEFPTDEANGTYIQAKSAYETIKKTYDRMKNLYDVGGISKQKLDEIKMQHDVNKAKFNAVSKMIKVTAPISGYITSMNAKPTDNIKAETILFTVSQTKKMKAVVWIGEEEITLIKKSMPANITKNGSDYNGKVLQVAIGMSPTKNAFRVDVLFDNYDNKLKNGIYADVELEVYSNDNAISIAKKDIRNDGTGKFVYVVVSGKAKKKYIKTGEESGINVEVVSGLDSGDVLIVEGVDLLQEGAKVRIEK